MLFGGNLLRQPAFRTVPHRVVGGLAQTERLLHGAFWVGVYPGLSPDRVARIVKVMSLVNSTPTFTEQHLVTNGCSELLGEVFGPQAGAHARSAFGRHQKLLQADRFQVLGAAQR